MPRGLAAARRVRWAIQRGIGFYYKEKLNFWGDREVVLGASLCTGPGNIVRITTFHQLADDPLDLFWFISSHGLLNVV
jgi:hypothetical protein